MVLFISLAPQKSYLVQADAQIASFAKSRGRPTFDEGILRRTGKSAIAPKGISDLMYALSDEHKPDLPKRRTVQLGELR
jgi:hypothetical protein